MQLAKNYEPNQYEANIYALWETTGAFEPHQEEGKPFYSIALPPPNANGNLHIGHALTVFLQDIQVRYHRMKGDNTVYIPGADHAGFETWVVYEKKLAAEGKSRFDFSREELYSQIWDFVASQRGNMEIQLRELGGSLAWDKLVFTLDEKVIKTAYTTFKKMWDEDLIYRGERIVNYCTFHQTSFSDIEVIHRQEQASLWNIAYQLADDPGQEIVVATTRPETLFGDTAIAVHPEDERYKHLVGKQVHVPLTGRTITIITDDAIDRAFGTGAVKITPAHDAMDFEIGERHNLERIQVIGHDGLTTRAVPMQFQSLDVITARTRTLAALEADGLLKSQEPHLNNVGHCYKCDTIIQPLIMDQWFVRVAPLAEKAIAAITSGDVHFFPESKGRELAHYLSQLRDWNLSRQPAWGVPIPAFQNTVDPDDWIFDERVDQKTIEVDGKTYTRDEDTFDTWFTSGQWPYITTDYLDKGNLMDFYPLSLMETGHDILRPWVGRMLMLGLYRTGHVPFKEVYLHGLVLDENGLKMSKSKGNVVNPQELVKEFGSDALRIGLIASRSAGQDQAFSTSKVIAGRNFCNKLWNMARFISTTLGDEYKAQEATPETIADHWVIRQLMSAREAIEQHLEYFRYAEAGEVIYHALWDDVADWYLEASKKQTNPGMLAWVLETSLQLAHPFAPFVTETIWQTLGWKEGLLISAAWPSSIDYHEIAASEFEQLQTFISSVRNLSKELDSGKQSLLIGNDSLLSEHKELVVWLAYLKQATVSSEPKGLRIAVENREAWLDIDADTLYEHQSKLESRLAEVRLRLKNLEARLSNENYVNNAPSKVVEDTRREQTDQRDLEQRIEAELRVIS
jgi:valyl-tRNA synthetase